MYGGHITDDIDRILCMAYLDYLMTDNLLDECEMLPYVEGKGLSFKCPAPSPYEKYIEHIEQNLPGDTPLAFGMHPNAEIDFRTSQCNVLFKTLQELQPADSGDDEEGGGSFSKTQIAMDYIDKLNNEVNIEGNKPNIEDIAGKMGEEKTPY